MPGIFIYTIGYGAREIDEFIALLLNYDIEKLIDIRTSPYSSYKPEYSMNSLQNSLKASKIRYEFWGNKLGGLPNDKSCYTDGKVDYEKVANKQLYKDGIIQIHTSINQSEKVVLMCSEGKPENCHRSKLIGRTLTNDGLDIQHIDERDKIISQDEVMRRLTNGQLSFFGDDFYRYTSKKVYRED